MGTSTSQTVSTYPEEGQQGPAQGVLPLDDAVQHALKHDHLDNGLTVCGGERASRACVSVATSQGESDALPERGWMRHVEWGSLVGSYHASWVGYRRVIVDIKAEVEIDRVPLSRAVTVISITHAVRTSVESKGRVSEHGQREHEARSDLYTVLP